MSRAERSGRKKGRTVFVLAALAVLGLLAWFLWTSKDEAEKDKALTFECNAERVEFLNGLGYIVEPDPDKEEIVIPAEFNAAYSEYNELQKQQGFDLLPYAGKKADKYTYRILNYPDYPENIVINLIFDDHRLIGADITYNDAENGFTKDLIENGNYSSVTEVTEKASETSITDTE